jgi:membrane protein DedA with SNARE-associated domain
MDALRPLFDWLVEHTYLVVFVGTLIDASGLPFPGRILLAAAGALAATGQANVVIIIALAALGAMFVDHLWYLTITRGSNWVIDLYCRLTRRQRNCRQEDADYFRRYGSITIILGRFFTVVRVVAWPMAAANGVSYARFVVLDFVGATIWASIWVLLGWIVGEHWESAAHSVGGWAALIGAVTLLTLAAPLGLRLRRRRAAARAAAITTRGGI